MIDDKSGSLDFVTGVGTAIIIKSAFFGKTYLKKAGSMFEMDSGSMPCLEA